MKQMASTTSLVRRIKLRAVNQRSRVMALRRRVGKRRLSGRGSTFQHFVLEARCQRDDAFFLGILRQERFASRVRGGSSGGAEREDEGLQHDDVALF